MIGLARDLAAAGEPVLNLLFHSSEAIVGGSPYNRTDAELAAFCDRLERFFDYAAARSAARPVTFIGIRESYTARAPSPSRSPDPGLHEDRPRHAAPAAGPGGECAAAVSARRMGGGAGRFGAFHRPSAIGPCERDGRNVTWIPRTKRSLLQRTLRAGLDRRRLAHPRARPAP